MLKVLIFLLRGIVSITKTLGWFFLLPFTHIFNLIKDWLMKLIVLLYRIWRHAKRNLQAYHGSTSHFRHIIRSIPIIILTVLVTGFNVHARQTTRELGAQTLLDQMFNQTEEFTVVESAIINENIESPTQLLAALETNPTLNPDAPTTSETDISNDSEQASLEELLVSQPDANGALVRPNVASTEPEKRENVIEYTVQSGDTISTIAQAYGVSNATVLWANNLSDHSIIRPGETLKILPQSGVLHVVKEGDTLLAIADKYDVEPTVIFEANELVSEHQLQIDQALIIPGGTPPAVVTKTTQLANFSKIFSPAPTTDESDISDAGYIWPTPSRRITQYYWINHKAIDVGGSTDQTIVATRAGRVEYSGWSNGYGNNVLINHGNGVKSRYAHLRELWVEVGDQVEQGEGLGKKGTTGRSTGVHLHFEIIINGVKVNPLSYL